jgi:hypothetical protein
MSSALTGVPRHVLLVVGRLRRRANRWKTDLQRGIRTRGVEFWGDSGLDKETRHYEPSDLRLFQAMLPRVPVDPAEYSFIDLGAGRGAAVVFAAEHGFRRSIGVELSEQLTEDARRNVRRLMTRRPEVARRMEVLNLDARDYEFPAEPSVLYLYNPFGPQTLKAVLYNLEASLRAAPRPVYVLYVNPVLDEVFAGFPALRLIHRDQRFLVFEHEA